MNTNILYLLFGVNVCFTHTVCEVDIKTMCNVNEYASICAGCDLTCENRNLLSCIDIPCIYGCRCEIGHVRSKNNKCIPVEQCPEKECEPLRSTSVDFTCTKNNRKTSCTGMIPHGTIVTMKCKRNYYGESDLVNPIICNRGKWSSRISHCVEACPANKTLVSCVACRDTCEFGIDRLCNYETCVSGCDCKPLLLRNSTNHCVRFEDCPNQRRRKKNYNIN